MMKLDQASEIRKADRPDPIVSPERFLDWAVDNPTDWVEHVLGCTVWWRQRQILESMRKHKKTCVSSGNTQGKDWIAGRGGLWFNHTFPYSKVITTGPGNNQVKNIVWRDNIRKPWFESSQRIREVVGALRACGYLKDANWKLQEPLTMEYHIDDGWYMIGFKPQDYNPERFGGFHAPYVLVIVTEASGVKNQAIWEGIEGLMSAEFARLLEVGNPLDPECEYARHFDSSEYNPIYISAWECPNVQTAVWARKGKIMTMKDFRMGKDPDELVESGCNLPQFPGMCDWKWPFERLLAWGAKNPHYVTRVKGQFVDAIFDQWITRAQIRYAKEEIQLEYYDSDNKVLAIDPARYGNDDTGFTYRIGPCVLGTASYGGVNPTVTGDRVAHWIKTGEADLSGMGEWQGVDEIRVDCDGMPGTLDQLDQLQQMNQIPASIRLVEIHSAGLPLSRSNDFFDRRSEMWGEVSEMFDGGEIDMSRIDDTELEKDLRGPKYTFAGGKQMIEKKEKTKKTIGRSPNKGDSFVYAFCRTEAGLQDIVWADVRPM